MKLLLDNMLSHKLIAKLRDIYDITHTSRLNLSTYGDGLVWKIAAEQGLTIVTKDADFNSYAVLHGYPPRVIWLRIGDVPTAVIELCLRSHYKTIKDFHESDKGVLELHNLQP